MALRNRDSGLKLPLRVWDAPTRLFHWAIVLLIPTSYVTVHQGWMQLHMLSGYTILTLVLFRVIWGFVGSETSRFSRFLHSPLAVLRQLAQFRDRSPDTQIGHNPAGGWMVLVILAVLGMQLASGLSVTDEDDNIMGPLAKFVGPAWSDRLTSFHILNFKILLGVIVLHVLAVAAYAMVKRHDLVRPMITGKKRLPAATRAPRMTSPLLALVILVVMGVCVWLLATRV
jgi:cytochrome b